MTIESLAQFRQIVLQDVTLQEQLRAVTDHQDFIDLVVRVGEEKGCHFTAEDVQVVMRESRQVWIERWI